MARRKIWEANRTGVQTLGAGSISLATVESKVLDIDIAGMTLIRMIGTFACRMDTVVQAAGWVYAMWKPMISSLDSADITQSDFDSQGWGAYHIEDIPLTGYASDSTTLNDQRPLTIVRFDVHNMRRIRPEEHLFLSVLNQHGTAIEFTAITRTLWMLP